MRTYLSDWPDRRRYKHDNFDPKESLMAKRARLMREAEENRQAKQAFKEMGYEL